MEIHVCHSSSNFMFTFLQYPTSSIWKVVHFHKQLLITFYVFEDTVNITKFISFHLTNPCDQICPCLTISKQSIMQRHIISLLSQLQSFCANNFFLVQNRSHKFRYHFTWTYLFNAIVSTVMLRRMTLKREKNVD